VPTRFANRTALKGSIKKLKNPVSKPLMDFDNSLYGTETNSPCKDDSPGVAKPFPPPVVIEEL